MLSKKKEPVNLTGRQNGVVTRDWNTPEQLSWRQKYDQDRSKAFAEGRSCGKCIESVVYFGPGVEDKAHVRVVSY